MARQFQGLTPLAMCFRPVRGLVPFHLASGALGGLYPWVRERPNIHANPILNHFPGLSCIKRIERLRRIFDLETMRYDVLKRDRMRLEERDRFVVCAYGIN